MSYEFGCSVLGCEKEAKVSGKCMQHATDEIKAREAKETEQEKGKPEETTDGNPACARCGRKKSERPKRWNNAKSLCNSCVVTMGREKKEGRSVGVRKKPAGPAPPAKRKSEGRGLRGRQPVIPASPDGESDLISKLLKGFYAGLSQAKKHHAALLAIKDLTGAAIHLPEITF